MNLNININCEDNDTGFACTSSPDSGVKGGGPCITPFFPRLVACFGNLDYSAIFLKAAYVDLSTNSHI